MGDAAAREALQPGSPSSLAGSTPTAGVPWPAGLATHQPIGRSAGARRPDRNTREYRPQPCWCAEGRPAAAPPPEPEIQPRPARAGVSPQVTEQRWVLHRCKACGPWVSGAVGAGCVSLSLPFSSVSAFPGPGHSLRHGPSPTFNAVEQLVTAPTPSGFTVLLSCVLSVSKYFCNSLKIEKKIKICLKIMRSLTL